MKKLFSILLISLVSICTSSGQISFGITHGNHLNTSIDRALITKIDSKLMQWIGNNSGYSSNRYYLTCSLDLVNLEELPTTPLSYKCEVNVTLYVFDQLKAKVINTFSFNTKSFKPTSKGAMNSVLDNTSSSNSQIKSFLTESRKLVQDYAEKNFAVDLKYAENLESQGKLEEALSYLTDMDIADTLKLKMVNAKAASIYKRHLNIECNKKFLQAKAIWTTTKSKEAAAEIANLSSEINSEAPCFEELNKLLTYINEYFLDQEKKEWEYAKKIEENRHQEEVRSIEAWKQIGVTYGKNQPKIIQTTTFIRSSRW
jgi:hypothetical protein